MSGYASKNGEEAWAEMFSVYDTGTAYHPKAVVTMRWGEFKGTYKGEEIRDFAQKIIDRVKSGEGFARDHEQERQYCDELRKLASIKGGV